VDLLVAELKKGQANADVHGVVCELDNLKSIRAAAANYAKLNLPLHVLILNAGIMACPPSVTVDGFETQFGVNHIGHHLLTTLLLPIIKKSAPARIVVLSSVGHIASGINWNDVNWKTKGSYTPFGAYGQSKTANILFAKQLNKMLKAERSSTVCSVAFKRCT
jgi:NAD(P)-dependent dehydrogenase (short-subunit alcohol dehydrogenase family)